MQEVTRPDGFTTVQTKPECRNCVEMMECLRHGKKATEEKDERDELKKQEMIAQILDLSEILTNEVGSCVLEFLNRIYQSPLGVILFKNLLLFFEMPQKSSSFSLTVPVSSTILGLIQGEEVETGGGADRAEVLREQKSREGFTFRIILIQRHFPNNRKANMGLIAREVIRIFSSDKDGMNQICQVLTASESKLFRTMDTDSRVKWLMQRWGFQDELKAVEKEVTG
jgi:hypothetical protein